MVDIRLARQVGRVPSMVVPLDAEGGLRFERLTQDLLMIDLHQHTMVKPEDPADFAAYVASHEYTWGYDAVRAGRWTVVGAACNMTGLARGVEGSFITFEDLLNEIALMLADVDRQPGVMRIAHAQDVECARTSGQIGVLPVAEHLALGDQAFRVDVLYGLGVRLAGLTYTRRSTLGDGQNEDSDVGLSRLGHEVVRRMNQLGMVIDLSHAGQRTALETIEASQAPVVFSHNAAHRLRPTRRTRRDEELLACAAKGGLVCITAVPNSLSDDPNQDINCVLDHYDYMAKLLGVDHVGIGTDSTVGDHVAYTRMLLQRDSGRAPTPAAYLNGLESPADGLNIIRGLIARGYSDAQVRRIAGQNALDLLRRAIG
jgi:membrane dipeptidase